VTALARSKTASSTSGSVTYSISTPAAGFSKFNVAIGPAKASSKPSKDVEKAIYAYVRAVRALGRTQLNVSDISKALNISEPAVIQALGALRSKGIKFV
jgi:hypothetical protein